MNKKKILFVLDSLRIGGAEKSLITLLSLLDYEKYEVDLQLFSYDGAFMQWIPQEVNILPPTSWTIFSQKSLVRQLISCNIFELWTKIKLAIGIRKQTFIGRELDYFVWQQTKGQYHHNNRGYDIAIGYGQYTPTFYIIEKVKAKRKVGYLNVPYAPPESLVKIQQQYFEQLDQIIAVSEDVTNSISAYYPEFSQKVFTIKDPISQKFSEERASDFQPDWIEEKIPHLVTAARLVQQQKGMDILLETARILKEKGLNFRWFVLGEGGYHKQMDVYIGKHNLQDNLFLLGAVANPYPYLKHATLYVQTSRFEGFGLSIAEARLLNTPVVTTSYRGWEMQMKPEKNGIVTDIDAQSVANAISRLLHHPEQIEGIRQYLQTEPKGNPEEFEKFRKFVLQEPASSSGL